MLGMKEQAVEDGGAAAMTAEAELGVSCSLKLRVRQRLDIWHVTCVQLCSSGFLAEHARRRRSVHDPSVCYITLDTGWFFLTVQNVYFLGRLLQSRVKSQLPNISKCFCCYSSRAALDSQKMSKSVLVSCSFNINTSSLHHDRYEQDKCWVELSPKIWTKGLHLVTVEPGTETEVCLPKRNFRKMVVGSRIAWTSPG